MKKIFIGADHRGYKLKNYLMAEVADIVWVDVGAYNSERSDYPDFAAAVCNSIKSGAGEQGILLCGSGIGMSIAANRFSGIYAALCWNIIIARIAREDDGANILVIPADFISQEEAVACVKIFVATSFKGGRYKDRLDLLEKKV